MSLVQLIKDSPEERKKAWFTIEGGSRPQCASGYFVERDGQWHFLDAHGYYVGVLPEFVKTRADAISFFEHCHSWFAEGVNAGKVEIKREFRSLIMDE